MMNPNDKMKFTYIELMQAIAEFEMVNADDKNTPEIRNCVLTFFQSPEALSLLNKSSLVKPKVANIAIEPSKSFEATIIFADGLVTIPIEGNTLKEAQINADKECKDGKGWATVRELI